MKRSRARAGNAPLPWSDLGYAALQGGVVDTFDDRVSEDLIDRDDEREAVDSVVNGMNRSLN
jgi:hypothetical protein